MKLEQQVVSLELAKRLKELGVKQESLFYWYGGNVLRGNQLTQELRRHEPPVPAYTVAELGEMLPMRGSTNATKCTLPDHKTQGWFWNNSKPLATGYAPTEADARAKMLIYLIENKLLTV